MVCRRKQTIALSNLCLFVTGTWTWRSSGRDCRVELYLPSQQCPQGLLRCLAAFWFSWIYAAHLHNTNLRHKNKDWLQLVSIFSVDTKTKRTSILKAECEISVYFLFLTLGVQKYISINIFREWETYRRVKDQHCSLNCAHLMSLFLVKML